MSLIVTPEVTELAEHGNLTLENFIKVVRTSLPYFYARVELLAAGVEAVGLTTNDDAPTTETEWGQLLRGFASDPIREAMEAYFGIKLGFRNCCFTAATRPGGTTASSWRELFTQHAQILAQRPELVDC